jgi:hypothetical protein
MFFPLIIRSFASRHLLRVICFAVIRCAVIRCASFAARSFASLSFASLSFASRHSLRCHSLRVIGLSRHFATLSLSHLLSLGLVSLCLGNVNIVNDPMTAARRNDAEGK